MRDVMLYEREVRESERARERRHGERARAQQQHGGEREGGGSVCTMSGAKSARLSGGESRRRTTGDGVG